jgi:2-amino-4-hydroxy-6-hydroxymethyldihydropteridine diphosphokinase
MARAFISLGSNLGDREGTLRGALRVLAGSGGVSAVKCSPFYATKPWGYTDQPDFLNAAACCETALEPLPLLKLLQGIEQSFHRERHFRYGPRTLDLDLLLYDARIMESPELTLPHPRMTQRAFVLVPLCDLKADLEIPGTGKTAAQHLEALSASEKNGVTAYAG